MNDELCRVSYEYKRLQSEKSIGMPAVRIVKLGTFVQYREAMIGRGATPAQFKMPRVVRLPEMLELLRSNVE